MTIPNSYLFPYQPLDVAAYLRAARSPRAYDLPDFAAWIEEAARLYNLNPRWLLMVAEKEQSFLTRPADGSPGWNRACQYTMGYGATDSHDIPKYAGTQRQVFAAAKGLRGYLTPGAALYVGDLVGKPYKCSDGYYTPRTLAEAAALRYTPWTKYLPDNNAVWNALRARAPQEWDGGISMDLATVAEQVVAARKRGETKTTLGGVTFDLNTGGYCSRFVRQCHESAGLPTGVFSCCAHSTAQHLEGAGKRVNTLVRGALMVWTNSGPACSVCRQAVWHIGIYLGDGQVAENTSITSRGEPRKAGTKVTPLDAIDPQHTRLWGLFSVAQLAPAYQDGPITVKVADKPYAGTLKVGVSYLGDMPVRQFEQVGGAVYDHIAGERTVYVYKAG